MSAYPCAYTAELIMQVLHVQVFQINPMRAWGAVATTVVSVALSIYLISIAPTYLLPLAWAFAGTAWTGVSQPEALYAPAASNLPCRLEQCAWASADHVFIHSTARSTISLAWSRAQAVIQSCVLCSFTR